MQHTNQSRVLISNPQVVIQKLDPTKLQSSRPKDDLRNHLNRKIRATINTNPNALKPFKLLSAVVEDQFSEEVLLQDTDNMSVLSIGVDEEKLLKEEEDFIPSDTLELDYERDTPYGVNINDSEFDKISIAPIDDEFSEEFGNTPPIKSLGKKEVHSEKSFGKKKVQPGKRKLDNNSMVANTDKILDWQNGIEKDTKLGQFKIPKVIGLVKDNVKSNKVMEKFNSTSYEKQYTTNRNDRRERQTRKVIGSFNVKPQHFGNKNLSNLIQTHNIPSSFYLDNSQQSKLPLHFNTQSPSVGPKNPRFNPFVAISDKGRSDALVPHPNVHHRFPSQISNVNEDLRDNIKSLRNKTDTDTKHDANFTENVVVGHPIERVQDTKAMNLHEKKYFPTKTKQKQRPKYASLCRKFSLTGTCKYRYDCKFMHENINENEEDHQNKISSSDINHTDINKDGLYDYGFYQKSTGTNFDSPIQNNFAKLAFARESRNYNDVLKIIQGLGQIFLPNNSNHNINEEDRFQFKKNIEDTILWIENDRNPANFTPNAELAWDLIATKRNINSLCPEDLFYCASIQMKARDTPRCLEMLAEMKINSLENKELKSKAEMLFKDCIDKSGKIFENWDEFKKFAVYNAAIMDKIFLILDFQILSKHILAEDLNICYDRLFKGRLQLSPAAKKIYLRLFTPTASINALLELLSHWDELSVVPSITVEKILRNIDFADIFKSLNILKRVPKVTLKQSTKWWNEVLENCCKKDNIQVSEQVFGVMQQASITCEETSSLRMLSALAKNKHFSGFLTRYEEIKSLFLDKDYVFPDWFADAINESLLDYSVNDVIILHRMITILIMSSTPPIEKKINNLLSSLRNMRKFQLTFEFVLKCFQRSVILSQLELRKTIRFLEEWTPNVSASITIYSKMREFYPRPEHLCTCSAETAPNIPAVQPISNNRLSSSAFSDGLKDAMDMIPTIETTEQKLLKLSAQLSASSASIKCVTELYMNAVDIDAANDDSIVFGLFMALSENVSSSQDFQSFVTMLDNTYEEFSDDIITAIGRLGVRLIQQHSSNLLHGVAYEILKVLHEKSLSYNNSGQPFGTLKSTNTYMSQCAICNLCCQVCNDNGIFESAYSVLGHCNYGEVEADDVEISGEDLLLRNEILFDTINGLIQFDSSFEKAYEVFNEVEKSLPTLLKSKLANALCQSFCEANRVLEARQLNKYIKLQKIHMENESIKCYVSLLGKNHLRHEAYDMFLKGLQDGTYSETYRDDQPLVMRLPADLDVTEIRFLIERHLHELRVHPLYGEDALDIPENTDNELAVVVLPCVSDLTSNIPMNMLNDIAHVVTRTLNPPLEIVRRLEKERRICLSLTSLLRWFPRNIKLPYGSKERTERFIDADSRNPITVTICPTPIHSSSTTNVVSLVQRPIQNVAGSLDPISPLSNHNMAHGTTSSYISHQQERGLPLDTLDSTLAREFIRKAIQSTLNTYYKKNYISPQEFPSYSRHIFEEYLKKLIDERGCILFNEDIGLDAHMFATSFAEERIC